MATAWTNNPSLTYVSTGVQTILRTHTQTYVNIGVLDHLTVLKEVNRELWGLRPMLGWPHLLADRPEHGEGTGGLEVGLQPELGAGVVVGHVDPQGTVLAQNDEGGARLGTLCGRGKRGRGRET